MNGFWGNQSLITNIGKSYQQLVIPLTQTSIYPFLIYFFREFVNDES
jgi:hypothetical protein